MMNDITSPAVERTLAFYGPMLRALEAGGCEVYVTGSAIIPGVEPRDVDIVVEMPPDWSKMQFEAYVRPNFRDIDAKEERDYERDADVVPPEDHESDRGIYVAVDNADTLPVQLLLFVKHSTAAGHWRTATNMLKANPLAYREREQRVRLFRTVRGQPVEAA